MVEIRLYDEIGRGKIRDFLKDCEDIADLGCSVQKIREDADGYDIDSNVKPEYVRDLSEGLNVYDCQYEGICASHLLEHIIDCRGFLKECYNGLKDNGRIAIIIPDGETVQSETLGDSDNTHEMLFTPITLKLYLENAGFKEVYTEYYERPNAWNKTKGIFARGIK